MQFDKFIGYKAVGDEIGIQPLYGDFVALFRCPPDIDPHVLAQALNDAANGVLRFLDILSTYKV